MMPWIRKAAILVFLLALAVLQVTAATTSCTVTTSGEAFGSYDPPANGADLTTGTMTVTCTGNPFSTVSYTITLTSGNGTFLNRYMRSGSNSLGYNLYVDSGLTSVWGDGSSGTSVVSDSYAFSSSNRTVARSYTVYGRISSNQTAARAGSYSDGLVVTVTYH